MTVKDRYFQLFRSAMVVPESSDYDLSRGEMNPEIISQFFSRILLDGLIKSVWEPFAGTSLEGLSVHRAGNLAEQAGIDLVSFGIEPHDGRIKDEDAREHGPGRMIGGMLFHPPYFGTAPFSQDKRDLSYSANLSEYVHSLKRVVANAVMCMCPDALVCAVGRNYRFKGEQVRLPLLYVDIFSKYGFALEEVWTSEPDIVTIFKN